MDFLLNQFSEVIIISNKFPRLFVIKLVFLTAFIICLVVAFVAPCTTSSCTAPNCLFSNLNTGGQASFGVGIACLVMSFMLCFYMWRHR